MRTHIRRGDKYEEGLHTERGYIRGVIHGEETHTK